MARIKYYNPETGKWEYADSSFVVGGNGSGNSVTPLTLTDEKTGEKYRLFVYDGKLHMDIVSQVEQ